MIQLKNEAYTIRNGKPEACPADPAGREKTMAYSILRAHDRVKNGDRMELRFDSLISHDITYVGVIQTAKASGLERFPVPYVLTNCHNSLCAVGGTINEDDHVFGLSAAKKYGGEFVPAHQSVIHSYMRERYAGGGKMIIGSDSHTRYGAYGTMAIGEGGPELVKQLLRRTYDIDLPPVVGVYLTGAPKPGVGPQDVALAIIEKTFGAGTVKNAVMEFFGPGIGNLAMDYRSGIDVMTTETSCLSSIWETDETVQRTLEIHGRGEEYKELHPAEGAFYDKVLHVELDKVECMIALPFHPSCAVPIHTFNENLEDLLHQVDQRTKQQLELKKEPESLLGKIRNGRFYADQGVIAGCSGGTFQNLSRAAEILGGAPLGSDAFWLSAYPASMPVMMELGRTGGLMKLMASGVSIRSAFCGPCFGAGDVPANNGLSLRHTTRNFPNREGSKIQNGQISSVALMDARSIAATAANKGYLTAATDVCDLEYKAPKYHFDRKIYENRVFDSHGVADPTVELKLGPNIKDWPKMEKLTKNLMLKVVSEIHDPVTTTDELIPSGETSSYRSNPLGLAEFALSRKDPAYVGRAKEVKAAEGARVEALNGGKNANAAMADVAAVFEEVKKAFDVLKSVDASADVTNTGIGSTIYAVKPGDGSAREQAASCQKVLGGWANIAQEYATKRYRSNLINWGMLPFTYESLDIPFANGDYIFVPDVADAIKNKLSKIKAYVIKDGKADEITLTMGDLTDDEREIILKGCLINYNNKNI